MLTTIVCTALMLVLLAFSASAMEAALAAAHCFATGVMPALLPMMVLGRMFPETTKSERFPWGMELRAEIFSFAAGSPASAQRAAGLRGFMNRRDWECLLCLTGVMSPMFLSGTLGNWLGSAREGRVLLGVHWLGAIIAAGIWRLCAGRAHADPPVHGPATAERLTLPSAIAQSAQSLLCVCGAMMVFSVAASLVRSLLEVMFPVWTAEHAKWLAVLWAVMEIGGGSSAVIGAFEKPHALLSALCGFGGLSIWMQNLLFLDKSIRPGKLLGMRALHGAVCYAIVKIFRPF